MFHFIIPPQSHLPEFYHSLFGSHRRRNIGKCGRLSQPSWLLVRPIIWSYLLTYLH